MASCKCGVKDDRPGSPPCDCEKIGNDDPIDGVGQEYDEQMKRAEAPVTQNANARQVGGNHYKDGAGKCPNCGTPLEHWDLAVMFKWDYLQGQIIKYVMRWRGKLGLQDLEKAKHNLEKYIEEIKAGRIQEPHP